MSTVKITDSNDFQVNAVPVNPDLLSAISRYAQSKELHLIFRPETLTTLEAPLRKAAATPVSLGMKLGKAFDFGAGQPQFSLRAGGDVVVHANAQKGSPLFPDDSFQSPILVKDGEAYLSLALAGNATGKENQTKGDLTAGFEAGAATTLEFFRRFSVDDKSPTLGQAIGEVISYFAMPCDASDLAGLREGDVTTCTGNRQLKFSGSFSAGVSVVPLASPALPLVGDPVQLNAGAKLQASASFEIASEWQIRVQSMGGGVVELGAYKEQGREWKLTVTPSAGVDVGLGDKDLLTALIDQLSTDPATDKKQLQAAGLQPDEIQAINAMISKSIDRSIHTSLSLELNGLDSNEAALLYRIETGALTASTGAAVTAALLGDFRALDGLNPYAEEKGLVGPGVTLLRSIATHTRKSGTSVKFNLIGLLNFRSLAEFISKSEVIHEPASGDVVFRETAKGERTGDLTEPQAQEKLRKAIFDSVLMTTVYRGGGALENVQMECSCVHFAENQKTDERCLSGYLDWFLALGLLNWNGKAACLAEFHGDGRSTCTARVALNDAASRGLFVDFNGQPRREKEYLHLGRDVLQALYDPDDDEGYRRKFLASETIWEQLDGQTTIGPVVEKEWGWALSDPRIAQLVHDYSVVVWWAAAMASTAGRVVEMQDVLKHADPATLQSNVEFVTKKDQVQAHVLNLLKKSPMSFEKPFGLAALAKAAGSAAVASGILLAGTINREFGGVAQHA